jgi:hypothetical protein
MTPDQRAALLVAAMTLLRTHMAVYRRDPDRVLRELLQRAGTVPVTHANALQNLAIAIHAPGSNGVEKARQALALVAAFIHPVPTAPDPPR